MKILNEAELANTRRKLAELESWRAQELQSVSDREVKELSVESLNRLIKQLKEEIAWSEAHAVGGR